jgi:protein-tyrosine phosphatase
MIDLHSHILFDLDDGARTLDDSLAMARLSVRDGVHTIAATPHSPASPASRLYDPAVIRERLAVLRDALARAGVALEVVAGTEIAFSADIVERLRRGDLLTYGGSRAILLELANNTLPPTFENALFNLQVAGYRVVLAHPERIVEVQQSPNRLLPFVERGVLMQVTAEALTGQQGERLRTTAETLLTHGMAHLLASDTHGIPPRRAPLLAAARDRAAVLVGKPAAEALVMSTPAAILSGQPLRHPPPRPVEQRMSRWRRLGSN